VNARKVTEARQRRVEISLPPSKSYTGRALIAASLADGESTIRNASASDDTELLIAALGRFGVAISRSGGDLTVRGSGGRFPPEDRSVYLGNSGTAVRFMASVAAIAPGRTLLEGDADMDSRPMSGLLDALSRAGIECASNGGRTPLAITGGTFRRERLPVDAGMSSQFLSSLLLAAPGAGSGIEIAPAGPVASAPYVGMTLQVMEAFGVSVDLTDSGYSVPARRYRPGEYTVEADVSGSTFFGSAAAVTGATVSMGGISEKSLQPDMVFYTHLARMGCRVTFHADGVEVTGPAALDPVVADLFGAPDSVPPLAVTAVFARGASRLTNVPHLKYKETDRMMALAAELPKIGAEVAAGADWLSITPGAPRPGLIETYNDHRIAMSFAVAGLKAGGMEIINPGCVSKSFPGFWDELEKFT